MNPNRKCIAKKANKNGEVFALVEGDVSCEVWKLCENFYNRECKGGMKKTWRYVAQGMTREVAGALFDRKTK